MYKSLFLLLTILASASALYGPRSDVVVVADEKTFKEEVLKFGGVAIVEFFAPWCGHCKSLVPEYEKAATVLKGVVKVVAVDATQAESLAQKYSIQGFPSLKVFGQDKRKPSDYNGGRTSDAIISECMKSANQLVKSRKNGGDAGAKKSSGSSSSGSGSGSGSSGGGSKSRGGSEVVELTELNFNALVMESNDHWLVEFYAPWCGHCKNLAPEWETAAKQLKGSVRLGAVDATAHASLAQKYGVKGYPTIKLFSAGKKKGAQDYNGPREAPGIVEYALKSLDEAGVPPNIPQITSSAVFNDACSAASGKICVVMFLPHILDSGAKGRNKYLDTLGEVAKGLRGKPFAFLWSEAGAQTGLESALEVNAAYPTLAVLSVEKKAFAVLKLSWNVKNLNSFLNGVISGSERTRSIASGEIPTVLKVKSWDGKDAEAPKDEMSLDELFGDDDKKEL